MDEPHKSAPFERQIMNLVTARDRAAPLCPMGAARLALRLNAALGDGGKGPVRGRTDQSPTVPVEESVQPGFIVCLETGEKLVLLRRHLKETLDMTPDEYRAKWGLPPDYPMAAEAYRKRRSEVQTP